MDVVHFVTGTSGLGLTSNGMDSRLSVHSGSGSAPLPRMITPNRRMQALLQAKRENVTHRAFAGGRDSALWRRRLRRH